MKYTKENLYVGLLFNFRESQYQIIYLEKDCIGFANVKTECKFTHSYKEFLDDVERKRYIIVEKSIHYEIF